MFVIRQILNNLLNRKLYTMILTLFTILQMTLLFVYSYNYKSNMLEYEKVCQTIPVTGKVANQTNTLDVGLKIDVAATNKLERASPLSDIKKTASLYAYSNNDTDKKRPSITINAINSLECIPALKKEALTFFKGYDEAFLNSDKNFAIYRKSYLDGLKPVSKNTYKMKVYYPEYDKTGGYSFVYKELVDMEVRAIGVYDDTKLGAEKTFYPVVIISSNFYDWLCNKNSYKPQYDSYSFTLAKPDELNQFKSAAKAVGFRNMEMGMGQMDYRIGNTLIINDKVFIESANHILRDHKLYLILYPVIFAIIALLSFSVSYLSLQRRKREIGIMYSMGVSPAEVDVIFTAEKMLISIFSILIVMIAYLLFVGKIQEEYVLISFLYLACDYLGTMIAQLKINKKSVLYILREE